MDFRLFSPLEVVDDSGRVLDLGTRKQRAVLAMLALEPGRAVSVDRLIDELWPDAAPPSAIGTLQAYVSHLRRTLEPDRAPRTPPTVLLTREPGYLLAVPPAQVDLARFRAWAADGHRLLGQGEPERALRMLDDALGLWRGEPLAEFAEYGFAAPVIGGLTESRATAVEDRFEARLGLGSVEIADLERAAEDEPYRERRWSLLGRALYRAERQTDALAALRRARDHLAEVGVRPGVELRRLETAILNHDPDLAAPAPEPVRVPPPARETSVAEDRLVGRTGQLDRIHARLADLRAGRGGVLLVEGEAGIGKTRLARAAAAEAEARSVRTAWGRCLDTGAEPPFWPWREALRELAVRGLDDGTDLFELAQHVLDVLTQVGPVLLVLDDVQWADHASLRLLELAAAGVARRPVLIVATLRPEPGTHPERLRDLRGLLVREEAAERIEVGAFTEAEVAEYLRAHNADPDRAGTLRARSDGNPFFLRELLRWRSDSAPPQGIRDVVGRRVARLPQGSQSLLRIASAGGAEVDPELLAEVAGEPVERVLSLLEPAVATGLLAESGWHYWFAHALVRESVYAELGRAEVARLHLGFGERLADREMRDGLAKSALLAYHFGQAAPVGGRAKAVEYAADAARRSAEQHAYDEAVGFWERALAAAGPADAGTRQWLLTELGRALRVVGAADRARVALEEAIELALRLDDRAGLIAAVRVFGGQSAWIWRTYGEVDDRMVGLLEDLLAGPLDDRDRAALLGTLGVELYYGPRRAEGERLAAEGVELARTVGEPELLATTLNNFYLAAWVPGRHTERRAAADELLAISGIPRLTELIGRVLRMACLLRSGELAEWDRDLARCKQLLAELAKPELGSMIRLAEAGRRMLDGDWAAAAWLAGESGSVHYGYSMWGMDFPRLVILAAVHEVQGGDLLDELTAQAQHPTMAALRPLAVLTAVNDGLPEVAHRLIDRWGTELRTDWMTDFLGAVWGFVAARLGTPDARARYDQLLPYADQLITSGMGMSSYGSYHLVLAELADRLGRHADARHHAEQAVAAHQRLGLGYWTDRGVRLRDSLAG